MTNMQVDWQSSFLEAIGPLAGIADPVTAIAKLSADAKMTAEAIYWTMCHAALFVFAAADLFAQEFRGAGDVLAVIYTIGHWGWNAWHINRKRQLALVAALMLCAGITNGSFCVVLQNETNPQSWQLPRSHMSHVSVPALLGWLSGW